MDDAFGAVHRKHASVYDVAALLPQYAGGLVLRELEVLQRLTERPGARRTWWCSAAPRSPTSSR